MLLSKHYNKNSFIKHICYHCNKWYGLIISQTSQIFTSHTMSYIVVKIVKNNCSSVQIHWEYFPGRVIPNVQKKTCSMMTKWFFFLRKKKRISYLWELIPHLWIIISGWKKRKLYSTKRLHGDLWSHSADKALRRGVANFLKCDWLAFLR